MLERDIKKLADLAFFVGRGLGFFAGVGCTLIYVVVRHA
ncbi:hypothetical protein AAKU67_002241 [Oxalobacteraceae bacterium GrIS 2.11]